MVRAPPLEIVISLSIQLIISGTIVCLLNLLMYWALSDLDLIPHIMDLSGFLIFSSYFCGAIVLYIACKYTMASPEQHIVIDSDADNGEVYPIRRRKRERYARK